MGASQSQAADEEDNQQLKGEGKEEEEEVENPKYELFRALQKNKESFDVAKVKELLKDIVYPDNLTDGTDAATLEKFADVLPNGPSQNRAYWGDWPLHMLVSRTEEDTTPDMVSLIKIFSLKGHPVDAKNILGSTALQRATACNNIKMVKALLDEKADRTKNNDRGMTAIAIAAYTGAEDILDLFLTYGDAKELEYHKKRVSFKNTMIHNMTTFDFASKQVIKDMINKACTSVGRASFSGKLPDALSAANITAAGASKSFRKGSMTNPSNAVIEEDETKE